MIKIQYLEEKKIIERIVGYETTRVMNRSRAIETNGNAIMQCVCACVCVCVRERERERERFLF